jgi:hypothetical protein
MSRDEAGSGSTVASGPMRRGRRAFAWLSGLVGVATLSRVVWRRRVARERREQQADPVTELRDTLARTRGEADAGTPPQSEPDPVSPEERRARVHERAQETIERMRGPSEP